MNYVLKGHDNSHAVEEMLFHLLPTEKPSHLNDISGKNDNYVVSTVKTIDDTIQVSAFSVYHDKSKQSETQLNVAGLDELEKKRKLNEAVKQTVYDAVVSFLEAPPPWGSLTGVRPAKFTRRFLEQGMTSDEVDRILGERYNVDKSRRALAIRSAEIAIHAQSQLSPRDISIYVGIPFCPSRCSYCSFVSHSIESAGALIAPYLDVLCGEIEQTGEIITRAGLRVVSVYIGGGTPTTLSADQLSRLLHALRAHFDLFSLREFTVEAGRPDTIDLDKLTVLKKNGVTRISINPQSMNDNVLAAAGRRHSAQEVLEAFELARKTGFDCINMDTIAGLDGDDAVSFSKTMDTLIGLHPENITVHTLAIKRGADMSDKIKNQEKHREVAKMLNAASKKLTLAGYEPYYLYRQKFMAGGFENVGWCKKGYEGLYNVFMMEELQTIVSLGAGGVTKLFFADRNRIVRLTNPKYPYEYNSSLNKINTAKLAILNWAEQLK